MLGMLLRLFGKTYNPDPRIPMQLVLLICAGRIFCLAKGLVRVQKLVFIGRGVSLRGKKYIVWGKFATIENGCTIDGYCRDGVKIGNSVKVGANSHISCTSHLSNFGNGLWIGDNSGFGEYCYFGASGGVKIGNDVIAGQFVSFHSENHIFEDPSMKIRDQGVMRSEINIGNDVWIGARVTFLAGSEVGDHSVVAAGAVVNGRFGANSLIGGVPAKIIRSIEAK